MSPENSLAASKVEGAASGNDATVADKQSKSSALGRQSPKPVSRTSSSGDSSDQLVIQGQAYLYGTNVPRNCDQALKLLHKAADLGNARARSQLGALYATGHCVNLDRARAYDWYSLAAGSSSKKDVWVERNRDMLWNEMTPEEKARAKQDSTN